MNSGDCYAISQMMRSVALPDVVVTARLGVPSDVGALAPTIPIPGVLKCRLRF